MKRTVALILFLFSSSASAACVILLHGLARTETSMQKLESKLNEAGHQTVNLGYPSRDFSIEVLADQAISPALKECGKSNEVSFVTHSLGGILVRQYLSTREIQNLQYVVMLGPPNKGSEVVDKLSDIPGFHLVNGDAGLQLGTDKLSIPNKLGSPHFNVGIIAGTRSINWILSSLIPGVDDGKVSIERTKLDGMNDHIQISTTHPFMMDNEEVITQVIYYLDNGRFEHHSSSNNSSSESTALHYTFEQPE